VETELERMTGVMRWAIAEMDQRYRILEEAHARDLEAYNRWALRNNRSILLVSLSWSMNSPIS